MALCTKNTCESKESENSHNSLRPRAVGMDFAKRNSNMEKLIKMELERVEITFEIMSLA